MAYICPSIAATNSTEALRAQVNQEKEKMSETLTGKQLRTPILIALGHLTKFEAHIGVESADVIALVCEGLGIKEDAWGLCKGKGDKDRTKVNKNVGLGFRDQREGYCGKRVPLTIQMKKDEDGSWIVHPAGKDRSKSYWALSEAGVEKSRELTSGPPTGSGGGGGGGGGEKKTPTIKPDDVSFKDTPKKDPSKKKTPVVKKPPKKDPSKKKTPAVKKPPKRSPAKKKTPKKAADAPSIVPVELPSEESAPVSLGTLSQEPELREALQEEIRLMREMRLQQEAEFKAFMEKQSHEMDQVRIEMMQDAQKVIDEMREAGLTSTTKEEGSDLSLVKVKPRKGENLTQAWVRENYVTAKKAMMTSVKRHLVKSEMMNSVEDYVHDCLLKLMRNDNFAPLLQKGLEPTKGALGLFAVQSGKTQMYKDGQNPSSRVMWGSRTSTEVKRGETVDHKATEVAHVVWGALDKNGEPQISIAGVDGRETIESKLAFEETMEEMERIIRRKIQSKYSDRYVALFQWLVRGEAKPRDIAEMEGIQRNTASNMTQHLRKVLRQAAEQGFLDAHLPAING
jgi:hypothetical protein